MSPEIVCEEEYDHRCDTWAIGIVTYILLAGRPPFNSPDNDRDDLDHQIVADPVSFENLDWSPACKNFISECLTKDQKDRPFCAKMLYHGWIMDEKAPIVSDAEQKKVVD